MSKENTIHIIGFEVAQYQISLPTVIDLTELDGYYIVGCVERDYTIA